ncbi:MAG TPA: hypothetical protein VNZ48_16395 [Xanthobacteraceae bacterium]|jgi:hypothetical protein|nr:hypothetical protein [Xanthobacteraceae bacterium]
MTKKSDVKQMKAALIYSVELIPFYGALSLLRIFGLPNRQKVHRAAEKIGALAIIVNAKSGAILSRDLIIAEEIVTLLDAKVSLINP